MLLNVNVPYLPGELKSAAYASPARACASTTTCWIARKDPRGRPYYWIGGEAPTGVPEDGTDFGALAEGYVSITPLQLDLTAHQSMEMLRGWSWE